MNNVQNAVNQLSGRTTALHADAKSIQFESTAHLSRHCIQFAPTRVHHNTRSVYLLVGSYKIQ